MRPLAFLLTATAVAATLAPRPNAEPVSGVVGIYGIVQRVELEPNADRPERIRIWGAFAFVNGGANNPLEVTPAKRGQLYFYFPSSGVGGQLTPDAVRKEWADIRAVAGTGQAIGFGGWWYGGVFSPSVTAPSGMMSAGGSMGTAQPIDTWVRPDSARTNDALMYLTNVGLVKLSESGGHAAVIRQLRAALR
jgi:hypothetical protein